ncbi:acyl-CoA dehydrogenase family protein [Pseudonocardia xishanensis]|uniref:Acyl-CoA dehydrogenase family protein n=1 Tax=Pseudonocardia xishanensis TaxID=630995 RepID=A0ABP8RSW9_9PSEU
MGVRDVVDLTTLPEDAREMKRAAQALVDRRILPYEVEIGLTGEVPDEIVKTLKETGYYGLTVPEEYGGLGVDHLTYCAVLEELARAPKPVWNVVNVANGVASRLLARKGTAEQRATFLPRLAAGELCPSITVTEPEAGSDVQGLRTTARRVDGGWVLDGTKHYITFGGQADVLFVLARTPSEDQGDRKRFTLFLVERGNPGYRVARYQQTMAGPPHEQTELVFTDCFVADDRVLGGVGKGLATVLSTFAEERISMSVTALGAAQRALELATAYARDRTAFGSRIGDFQGVLFPLADSATELAAARALTYDLARRLSDRVVQPHEAAVVKLFAAEMAGRVADRCVQVFGGAGFMAESPVSRIYRDVRVLRLSGGTSEIQRTLIGRALLKED